MSQKSWMALIGALIVGVVAWFALRDDSVVPVVQAPDDSVSTRPVASVPAVVSSAGDESVSERVAVRVQETLLPLPEDAAWSGVLVVDGQTGEPIPGATVRWVDASVQAEVWKLGLIPSGDSTLRKDHEQFAKAFGWVTRSDETGRARVHRSNGTEVFARKGSLFGTLDMDASLLPPRDGFVVELDRDFGFDVRVVDAAGNPAVGVPVDFAAFEKDGSFAAMLNWGAYAMSRAPDGYVRIAHTQEFGRLSDERDYRVFPLLPGLDHEGVRFDPRNPPAEPVVLQLPPTGVIKVRARVAERDLAIATCTLRADRELDRHYQSGGVHAHGPDENGWMRFEHVPLATSLRLRASTRCGLISKVVKGPTAAGGVVEVTMSPSPDSVQFRGRLLFADRSPVAQRSCKVAVSDSAFGDADFETDANGLFHVVLDKVGWPRGGACEIGFYLEQPGEPELKADVEERELRAGIEDLGDIVLSKNELVLAGTCEIDGKPAPLPEARIEVAKGRYGGRIEWDTHYGMKRIANDDGTFEFRGDWDDRRMRLRVYGSWLDKEPIEFTKGQRDLHVSLRSSARLSATMLLTNESSFEPWVAVRPADGGEEIVGGVRGRGRQRFQVDWASLRPGTYELLIGLYCLRDPVHVITDVVVPPPEGGDPRLVDIDLRDLFRVQVVTLLDSDGDEVDRPSGGAFPFGQTESGDLAGFPIWGATTRLLAPASDIDVLVAIDGFRPQRVTFTGEPLKVRLEDWPVAAVHVPAVDSLPEGWELRLSLARLKSGGAQWGTGYRGGSLNRLLAPGSDRVLVENGRAELHVGEAPRALRMRLSGGGERIDVPLPNHQLSFATPLYELRIESELQRAVEILRRKLDKKRK